LWDGDHHVTSLSGCDIHLEADAKVLATSLKRLACFIQKHPLKGRPIEQFPSVLEIGSYVWRLLQAVSTNSVASAAELEVIKQWLKKTAGLGEVTKVEPRLPQSKSFLKILGVPYWDSKSPLLITPAQVEVALSNSLLFESVSLASMPHIMKASPSSNISVIWIDIWDSQKGSKSKTLINHSFNFEHHTATV